MEETTIQNELLATSQKNMLAYFDTLDLKYVAEDAVYRNFNTGQVHIGKAEIGAMLHYTYHVAFDAHLERTNSIITEDKALLEGYIKGKHIGEFMGIAATNKDVQVPISVSYTLRNGLIQEARIYMAADVLRKQLGVPLSSKTTFLIRDIFQLKFGHFKEAKALLQEARQKDMLPADALQTRVLTDFTGDAYRLIFEEGFDHLGDYEASLNSSMHEDEWKQWYEQFKQHVESSHREILKQIF
ncbi:MAG: ester cyclase [Flavisolibacter sp.]